MTGEKKSSSSNEGEKSGADGYRKRLVEWDVDDGVAPQTNTMGKWFTGEHFNWLPSKTEARKDGLEPVLHGFRPKEPIINPETRVIALGSCFARYFILWLADHGFNKSIPQSPYNALLRFSFGFESPSVIAQQFRWAFGEFDSKNALWVGKDKELFEATEERRQLVRETLENTEVLVITLGLSEIWYDKKINEPLWRALPEKYYDPNRHVFKVESCADTIAALEKIEDIRKRFTPGMKVVYTISPVRLKGTFRPISAISANSVSKAILRAGLDEFLRNHWEMVGDTYYYFPSYEIVMEILGEPFRDDNRHLYDFVPQRVLSLFARHYTTYKPDGDASAMENAEEVTETSELRSVVAQLEAKNTFLQDECDKRLKVIEELDGEIKRRDANPAQTSCGKPSLLKRLFKG